MSRSHDIAASAPIAGRVRAAARLGLRAAMALLVCASVANPVRAEQPADWMFHRGKPGSRLTLDYLGTGAQLSYNYTQHFFSRANTLDLWGNVLTSYPLGQAVVGADLRLLFINIGGSVGYRSVWRSLRFAPGEDGQYCVDCDRKARTRQDRLFRGGPSTDAFGLVEAHLDFIAPLNDYVVFASSVSPQYEGRKARSFDWWYGTLHDGGVIWNWPTRLYLHHPDWGGIAGYVHYFRYPQAGEQADTWAYGFEAVRRLGLLQRNDLLFMTFLVKPGDRDFGHHTYYGPIRALLIYRAVLHLD